jgi:hypothetical protein
MPDLMRDQLGAYLDGELRGQRLLEMQAHLETCPSCQKELDELRQLSHLLRAAPLPEFTPASRFASQLMLQLPRRDETVRPVSRAQWIGWLIPVALLIAWVFIQVTVSLASVVSVAGQAGWLGESAAWVIPGPQQMPWFAATQALLGNSLNMNSQVNLEVVNQASLFVQDLIGPFFLQSIVAVLYLAWLAIWWPGRQSVKIVS